MDWTSGLNIEFPIYKEDGTSFNGLVLRKATVDTVVMSLGDKITGDVYYKDNSLAFTMHEYVVYKDVKYTIVNPPTVVREGLVRDNSELKGMTKYSFEFYHPMYLLNNLPFADVAVSSDETRYLSENKTFSWIGKPDDFIAKLNKNLEGTEWVVVKSDRFPKDKANTLSQVLQFDKNTIGDAMKKAYEEWDIPYVIDSVSETEQYYGQGKRFKVVFGLPSNEIYETDVDRQAGTPFVFKMGQGVGLKNNSRTPRNNKIVTRLSGYGSERNIPYGYPQIVWTGDQSWTDTKNNPNDPTSYPLYKGIVGGRYVKLIKHPFTRTHLMPSVYRDSVNKKVNPFAQGYNPNIELVDYYDAKGDEYPNKINEASPSYEIHEFDTYPQMNDGSANISIVNAVPLDKDLNPVSNWDDSMDDEGNYIQSYFQITLPRLSFDIYACAAITEEMKVNMRSGACIGCTFDVQVDWEDYKNNFYDANGDFAPDGTQRDTNKYPKSNEGSIVVVVKKDNTTFGTLMPNIYQNPKSGDEFVVLGISLPNEYIESAETKLDEEMKSYMLENNVYYYDYPLKFDEYFLATHTNILSQVKTNNIVHFDFSGNLLQLFVKQITIKYGNAPLPQYDITLSDNIEVVLNQIGKVADDVEHLGSLISMLRQTKQDDSYSLGLAQKLSKVEDDTARGLITFLKGLVSRGDVVVNGLLTAYNAIINTIKSSNYTGDGVADSGWLLTNDYAGSSRLVVDYLYARKKAVFESLEIKELQFTSGDIAQTLASATIERTDYLQVDEQGEETILGYSDRKIPWTLKGFLMRLSSRKPYALARNKKIRINLKPEDLQNVNRVRCYFLAKDENKKIFNLWKVNDLARCQTFNIDNIDRETYAGETHKAGNVYWWRLVKKISTEAVTVDGKEYHYFDVAYGFDEEQEANRTGIRTPWCDILSDLPAAGDKVVQFGNTENPARMNIIVSEVNGEGNADAPAIKSYRGVHTFNTDYCWWGGESCRKMMLSPSSGVEFYAPTFKFITEYGIERTQVERGAWLAIPFEEDTEHETFPDYSDDILDENGNFVSRSDGSPKKYVRKCRYYDRVEHKGSTWLCTIAESHYWRKYNNGVWSKITEAQYQALPQEEKDKHEYEEVRNYTTDEPSKASNDWTVSAERGQDGSFKSRVFCRTNINIKKANVRGGSYDNPIPTLTKIGDDVVEITWEDGVPQGTEMLWSTVCTFYGDGSNSGWSKPSQETDTETLDIEFSPNAIAPDVPVGTAANRNTQETIEARQAQGWYDPSRLPADQQMIYRAECKIKNGVYEMKDGYPAWVIARIKGEKGTSVREVKPYYAKQSPESYNGVPPQDGWEESIAALGTIAEGWYVWTKNVISFTDNVESTTTYTVSKWGIDGDGIENIETKFYENSLLLTQRQLEGKDPVSGMTYVTESDWKEYGQLALTKGDYIYTRTKITYDKGGTPTISYQVNRLGQDGVGYVATEEYYVLGNSQTDAPSGHPDTENQPYKKYTAAEWQQIEITGGWSESRPTYQGDANKYLWNFEVSFDTDGNAMVTRPICIGNYAKGIMSIVETYAISAYAVAPQAGSYPSDITTWTDEAHDCAPTDEKPYQWNKTVTSYSDGTNDTFYHVSAVKGTRGIDGKSVFYDEEHSSIGYAYSSMGTPEAGRDYPSDITRWYDNPPAVQKGKYLWTKDVTAYNNGGTLVYTTTYGVQYQPNDGESVEIDSSRTFIKYCRQTKSQYTGQHPADSEFSLTYPTYLGQGDYLWILNQVAYVGVANPLKSYSVSMLGTDGRNGDKGADGYTTHFAYATSADGSQNFSTTNFNGATYIGTYRDRNAADSTNYRDYVWTPWKGDKGEQGEHGDDGYGLSLTPTSLILESTINGSQEVVNYVNNVVTVRVMKGSTPVQLRCRVLTTEGSYSSNVTPNQSNTPVTDAGTYSTVTLAGGINLSNGESGFFTVQVSTNDGKFSQNVRINFYVNRAATFAREIKNGIETAMGAQTEYSYDQLGGVIKTAYQADIQTSAKGLTQQFTEQISKAGDYNRNLFGFHKGANFSLFATIPFIQGYGLVVTSNNGNRRQGRVSNLGFENVGGYFVVTFMARTNADFTSYPSQQYAKVRVDLCDVEPIHDIGSIGSNINIAVNNNWQSYEFHFFLPEEISYISPDSYNGFIDFEEAVEYGITPIITNQGAYIYIRHLKIERGQTATKFCEADEDVAYLGQGNVAKNLDFRPYRTEDAENQTVDGRSGVYRIRMPYLTNPYPWGDITYRDYLFKNDFFNLEAGKCYTLSFWAKSSVNGFIITQHLYKDNYSIINSIGNDIYVDPSNGTIQESIMSDGQTQVKLSTTWTQYFVHFYVANNVPSVRVIPLRVLKSYNNLSARNLAYIYMSDIELQEGYVTPTDYFASFINQNARRISLVQQSGTKLAGVDIQNGMVNLMGDRVTFSNSTGTVSGKVWIDPDNGTIHATDGKFSGEVTATSGTIGGFTIDTDRLYNSNWNAGIDINYDGKTVKIGKNAQGIMNTEDAIIRAENTKALGGLYNTALYLNASGATYNYAFYGNGNGVLNGLVFGYKVQLHTILSGNTDVVSYLNISYGSTIILNGSHSSGIVSLAAPRLSDVRKCLGINSSTTPFAIEFTVISHAQYGDVNIAFRTAITQTTTDEYPWLMDTDDGHISILDRNPTVQIAQGDVVKILLVYDNVGTISSPNYEYRAYDLIRRV